MLKKQQTSGFTIVELLIVVVVIAILAAITIVSYNGIQKRAAESVLKSDIHNAVTAIETAAVDNPTNPTSFPSGVRASGKVGLSLSTPTGGSRYCVNGTYQGNSSLQYYYDSNTGLRSGSCSGAIIAGSAIGTASSGSATLVTDNFNRANVTNNVGTAQTGQTWVNGLGAWGISSNQAYSNTGNDGDVVAIDLAPTTNVEASVRLYGLNSSQYPGLMVRVSSDGKRYIAEVNGGNGQIVLGKDAPAGSELALSSPGAYTQGAILALRAKDVTGGVQLTILVNGAQVLTYTDTASDRLYGTGVGLRNGVAGTTTQRFDDFSVVTAN